MKTSALISSNPFLSIIIVTHNAQALVNLLMQSVYQAVNFLDKTTEIIIVDNASTDNTCKILREKYKDVLLLTNRQNLGYAKANNQAITRAKGKYILLLNSDTQLSVNVLKKMIDYMENDPGVGVVTCKVLLPDGSLDPACHRGFPTPWASATYFLGLEKLFPHSTYFSQYHLGKFSLNTIHEIDSPSGAFFLVRKEAVKQVGLLDETFFMYGEDLDWSYRIKKNGWKIIYNPGATIIHYKKQSGLKSTDPIKRKKTLQAFYDAMKIFYNKHYSDKYPKIIRLIIFFLIDLKRTIELIKQNLLWI